eukprot:5387571-Amphidinium_carterae.1
MIFSAGTDQLGVLAYVPEEYQKELSSEEWLKKVLDLFGGEIADVTPTIAKGKVMTDGNKNIFPLKIREPMILEANNFLRCAGICCHAAITEHWTSATLTQLKLGVGCTTPPLQSFRSTSYV